MTPADTAQVSIPTQRGRVGRPPMTSSTEMVAAARRIGFEHLTVGRVTTRCGVKYSSFYRHWPSLEALTAATIDDVLAEVVLPDDPDWRTQIGDSVATLAGVLTAHPGMAAALAGVDPPDWLARARERCVDRMLDAGMSGALAASGAGAVLRAVTDPRGGVAEDVRIALDGIDARGWGR